MRIPLGTVDILNRDAVATWMFTGTGNNVAATVVRAGVVGQRHYITGISGSFSAAAINLLLLREATVIIGSFYVHNQRDIAFDKPIMLTDGAAAELSLAASGTAGNIGAVTMMGYTA